MIEAYKEERTWLARELHDDINQRLALVMIELDGSIERVPPSVIEVKDKVHAARQRVGEIATDIPLLSHHLHSSKLEYLAKLGIGGASRGFCRELSEQKQVSLGLFRVLQEALENAVKYSGVRHFTVELRATPEEVQLTVTDSGVGFDPQQAVNHRALGLVSMKERIALVNGEFSIKSQPPRPPSRRTPASSLRRP